MLLKSHIIHENILTAFNICYKHISAIQRYLQEKVQTYFIIVFIFIISKLKRNNRSDEQINIYL